MGNSEAFLGGNAVQEEPVLYAASKRFLGEDGKPILWEIKAIESELDEVIRKKYTKSVSAPGKKHQFIQDFHANAYLVEVAANSAVFPDLKNAELQNSYGVMGEAALLRKLLKPGELQAYLTKINEVNGFADINELVEQAKN